MKAIYRHKQSGDIFAIEINEAGQVISTSGALLTSQIIKLKYEVEHKVVKASFERDNYGVF